MFTQMGQFIDHDITFTPVHEGGQCCSTGGAECFNIAIPAGDDFFTNEAVPAQTCIDFHRSTALCESLISGRNPREQINGITAFVDASNVYGSDSETAVNLRTFSGGKLVSEAFGGYEMLPTDGAGVEFAGDVRVREMPGLASMHTLWLREHNRIAEAIAANLGGNDEDIYQTARKIVIGEMQHIVYSEYLPVLLGPSLMRKYDLDDGRYSSRVDPSIRNSFATAAYRFGHSMIQGIIKLMDEISGAELEEFELRDNFFQMAKYYSNDGAGMEQLIKGLVSQPSQTGDRFVTEEATNHLFQVRFGFISTLCCKVPIYQLCRQGQRFLKLIYGRLRLYH